VIIVYDHRSPWLGIASAQQDRGAGRHVLLLVILGWAIARDFGRASPLAAQARRPCDGGTIGFLVRLVTLLAAVIVALRFAGVRTADIAIGASFTAVVFGLAASRPSQPDRRIVLLSARPFRVGERVRLQGGMLAGQVEGTVTALGLLYTTFATARTASSSPTTRSSKSP